MNIVYLAHARIPTHKAHGIQISHMCEAFAKQAHVDTVFLVVPYRKNPIQETVYTYYDVANNFTVKTIYLPDIITPKFPGILDTFAFYLHQFLFFLFARVWVLSMRLRGYVSSSTLIYSRQVFSRLFFSQVVVEIHDIPKRLGTFFRFLVRRTKNVVVITQALRDIVCGWGVSKQHIFLAHDAVAVEKFYKHATDTHKQEELVVMYTGSFGLYSWKGVDVLLEAATKVFVPCRFVLVGARPEEAEVLRMQYPQEHIEIVGYQEYKHMPEWVKQADILVLPNKAGSPHSEKFTSPLKAYEYLATGVPIISSDLASLRETFEHAHVRFFTANDSDDLARHIADVIASYPEEQALSVEKNKLLAKERSWTKRAQDILAFMK